MQERMLSSITAECCPAFGYPIVVHSDGTLFRKQGAFAYSVQVGETMFTGSGLCKASSYVAEIEGILRALQFCKGAGLKHITLTIDHLPLFTKINTGRTLGQYSTQLVQIRKLIQMLHVRLMFEPGCRKCPVRDCVHHLARKEARDAAASLRT